MPQTSRFLVGLVLLAISILVFFASLASGSRYVIVLSGLFIVGLYYFFRGLYDLTKRNDRRRRSIVTTSSAAERRDGAYPFTAFSGEQQTIIDATVHQNDDVEIYD